jgi:hypothetical protein
VDANDEVWCGPYEDQEAAEKTGTRARHQD